MNQQKGIIKTIILLVIAIVILKFWLKIDIVDFMNSERFHEWINYVKIFFLAVWEKAIKPIIDIFKK